MNKSANDAQIEIRVDDLLGAEIAALLEAHLDHMRSISPPESVHALDLEALRKPEITFWTMWQHGKLIGCGALREIDPVHAEIKSMHTPAANRGQGLGRRMVEHILNVARERGYERLSLETGATDDFLPARSLYASFGFVPCPPFGNYVEDPFSTCMTLELDNAS
ncbi:GNAT family N-acetyltransferase [Thalassospiraceae bacterium LMO-JJ14]|nr:GNAT family N-acetyltransferase [Thalassospiraceae bacterium LMO-JJ14]